MAEGGIIEPTLTGGKEGTEAFIPLVVKPAEAVAEMVGSYAQFLAATFTLDLGYFRRLIRPSDARGQG